MNFQKFTYKCISNIQSRHAGNTDWALFVTVLKYDLLSIVARNQREGISLQGCADDIPAMPVPSFGKVVPLAQKVASLGQRKIFEAQSKRGKKIIYSRLGDRFSSLYSKYLEADKYWLISDRYGPGQRISRLAPIFGQREDLDRFPSLFMQLLEALTSEGLHLSVEEVQRLRQQALLAVLSLSRAERFFLTYTVDALSLDGDSWLPVSTFALIAKEREIPALCIQHGLDCEHWCLDEASSKFYCVWGEQRKARYRKKSEYQPEHIFVTGNPLFDQYRPPKAVSRGGRKWLLLTRPHSPEKCYEASRYPEEGAVVLRSLITAIRKLPGAQLVIRPHPRDNIERYTEIIAEEGVGSCVSISDSSSTLYQEIQKTDVVLTEDTTSGMEAMFFEKPLVHVSACLAGPVLPFVEYGASFPGFSDEQLMDSLARLHRGLDCGERLRMHKGQLEFLHDFCGELDGKAGQRVASVIRSIL